MSETNAGKQQIGLDAKKALESFFLEAKEAKFIKDFTVNYRNGYKGLKEDQFYAPFLIEFINGDKWILYSTTSFRDRVKESLWDAFNLKTIDPTIKGAYLIYQRPTSEKELQRFASAQLEIEKGEIFTSLDGIVEFDYFRNSIETIGSKGKTAGFLHDARGNSFEVRVSNALGSVANLRYLKTGGKDTITRDLPYLSLFLSVVGLSHHDIARIESTADKKKIGLLPSGGKPKTDVLTKICFDDNSEQLITLSCKSSNAKTVTVGQHKADDICKAVDPWNYKLRALLNKFQVKGTLSGLNKAEEKELESLLAPKLFEFCCFILGGINGPGNPDTQWAKYIFIAKDDVGKEIEMFKLEDYVKKLLSKSAAHYGTPFYWTFASGNRGKNIQFKVKIRE